MPSKGGLQLTGKLGEVIRESAQIGLSWVKAHAYELGLTVAGRGKLFVNGKLTVDNWTKQRPGEFFYG